MSDLELQHTEFFGIPGDEKTFCVQLSPDGRRIGVGFADGQIAVYDLDQMKEVQRFSVEHIEHHFPRYKGWDYPDAVVQLAFSPNSQLLASGGLDRQVKLWNIETGACINTFQRNGGYQHIVRGLFYNPSGSQIIVYSDEIKILNGLTGEWTGEIRGGGSPRMPREDQIVFGKKKELVLVNLAALREEKQRRKEKEDPFLSYTVRKPDEITQFIPSQGKRITSIEGNSCSRLFAVGSRDKKIRLWDVRDWNLVEVLEGPKKPVERMKLSPDGRYLASIAPAERHLYIWDLQEFALAWTITLEKNLWDYYFEFYQEGLVFWNSYDGDNVFYYSWI